MLLHHRLVANAGRLAVIPAQRLGLRKLVDNQVDLRANTGDNMLTLVVASALAGGKENQATESAQKTLRRNDPDRIHISFDDHRLVANAGLRLAVIPAQRLGLRKLVDNQVDFGDAPERANTGDNMLTLVASALLQYTAGGNCIDDAECRAPAALSHSSSSQNSAVTAATMVLIAS